MSSVEPIEMELEFEEALSTEILENILLRS